MRDLSRNIGDRIMGYFLITNTRKNEDNKRGFRRIGSNRSVLNIDIMFLKFKPFTEDILELQNI